MNIIMIGPPGCGKGTQSEILKKNGFYILSTGNIIREEIQNNTHFGNTAKSFIDSGKLLPDSLIFSMIFNLYSKIKEDKIIFDGFPRTLEQAKKFVSYMEYNKKSIDKVIYINIDNDTILNRIIERSKEENRTDDTIEIAKNRISEFNTKTKPVIDFFKEKGIVYEINGNDTIENISNCIMQELNFVT